MKYSDVIKKWNDQTKTYQWDDLYEYEKVRFAMEVTREECAKIADPTPDHIANPYDYLGEIEGIKLCESKAEKIRNCSDCIITFE